MQKVPCDQRVRELMETISVNAVEVITKIGGKCDV